MGLPAAARAQAPPDMFTNCRPGTLHAAYFGFTRDPVPERDGVFRFVFRGDVSFSCNDMTVNADEVEMVSDEDIVVARGHVVFKEPGMSINSEVAVVNRQTRLGKFVNVSGTIRLTESKPQGDLFGGLEPDAFFSGEALEKIAPKTYHLTNGILTTCTQPTPRWYMSFSGTITQGKHVFMRNVVLRAKGVPLLFLPAFFYPITQTGRSTGFLMPSYGSSSITGFRLDNAFFWVIGRSQDATISDTYFSKTGMGYGAEYRYVQTAGFGNVDFSVLDQKAVKADDGTITSPETLSYNLTGALNQTLPHALRVVANARYFTSAAAQQTYQQNIYDFSQRTSTLAVSLSGSHGRYRFNLRADQNDIYTGLTSVQRSGDAPMVDFSMADKPIGHTQIYFGAHGTSGYLVRQDNLSDPTTDHSLWRTDFSPGIHAPIGSLPFLRVTASASWRFTSWSESTTADDPNHTNLPIPITRQLFTTQIDIVGPTVSRVFQPKPNSYAEKFKHMIEPRISFSWNSPFHDQDRIVQLDPGVDGLVGGTATVSYGVTTTLLAKRWTGTPGSGPTSTRSILTASIRQSYFTNLLAASYSQQDSTTGLYNPPASSPFSPIALQVNAQPVNSFNAGFSATYDTHFGAIRDYSFGGGIQRPLVQINAGWTKRNLVPGLINYDTPDTTTNFINAGAGLRNRSGHLGGNYSANLDLKNAQFLQQRFVLFYNSQCCGISFDYQTVAGVPGLPSDRRFGFSFTLAGLGSFSNPFGSFGG